MASSSRVSRFSLLLLLSASQLLSGVVAYKQCYFPDGSIPKDLLWGACSSEGHSACCDVKSGDICQPNGLCLYSSSSTNNTYRGTCTDRTWTDPACPNICTAGKKAIHPSIPSPPSFPNQKREPIANCCFLPSPQASKMNGSGQRPAPPKQTAQT